MHICRREQAEEGGAHVRVPRRARHVADAEDAGSAGGPAGGEGGRRRSGRRGGRRRQAEEERVEAVHLLLLRVLSLFIEAEQRAAFLLIPAGVRDQRQLDVRRNSCPRYLRRRASKQGDYPMNTVPRHKSRDPLGWRKRTWYIGGRDRK
jgi:hypothetical protein